MKLMSNISELNQLALAAMIYGTCGEDEEILREAEVNEIEPQLFTIQYKVADPYEGICLTMSISIEHNKFHYNVISSAYADTGEFDIIL